MNTEKLRHAETSFTLGSDVGNNLDDIRDFIKAQPASTVIAVGDISNASVNIVQNFTGDHDPAVKALRLPSWDIVDDG